MLDVLADYCDYAGHVFHRLDGSTRLQDREDGVTRKYDDCFFRALILYFCSDEKLQRKFQLFYLFDFNSSWRFRLVIVIHCLNLHLHVT